MRLQLEYNCTDAEMKEAQSLNLHRQYGGGPKWRSRLVNYAFVAVVVGLFCLRFKTEIAPQDRIWFVPLLAVGIVVVFVALQFFKRFTKTESDGTTRLEISDRELVFNNTTGRSAFPWSAFSQCLESPTEFVLLNRPKDYLFVVPKRAFPDESSQNWFRTLANQPQSVTTSSANESSVPTRFAAKGISLTVQLKYRDYLTRMLTSWRMKGIALGMLLLVSAINIYFAFNPPPDAVNPPSKVFLITLAMLIPILVAVLFIVTFFWWHSEREYRTLKQVALTCEGIEFAGHDGSGQLAWTTYKYFLENRWAFFLWNPRGSLWVMFPKRSFISPSDLEQCRVLLQTNLRRSRWFFF